VDEREGKELTPVDEMIQNSPSKTARSVLNTGRSVRMAEGVKGGDFSLPHSRELGETARETVVRGWGEGEGEGSVSRPSTAETQKVGADADLGAVGEEEPTAVMGVNPFGDAFVNVPVVEEGTIPPPPTHAPDMAPDVAAEMTARTDMSEISDSVLNTGRSFPNVFGYVEPPNYKELFRSTRVRESAAVTIGSRARGMAGRERVKKLKAALQAIREIEEGGAEEEEEVDEAWDNLVDENEKLEEEKIKMVYQMEQLKRELEVMKSSRVGEEEQGHAAPTKKRK